MSDIVERLRRDHGHWDASEWQAWMADAADEIDSLRSRLAEYEKLLAQAGEAFTKGTKRLADLEAERALIIQRAENAEAALVAEVAKNGRHAMRVTIAQLEARLAEAESLFDADIVEIIYGPPCAEYEAECACCRAWRWLDGRNEHP